MNSVAFDRLCYSWCWCFWNSRPCRTDEMQGHNQRTLKIRLTAALFDYFRVPCCTGCGLLHNGLNKWKLGLILTVACMVGSKKYPTKIAPALKVNCMHDIFLLARKHISW